MLTPVTDNLIRLVVTDVVRLRLPLQILQVAEIEQQTNSESSRLQIVEQLTPPGRPPIARPPSTLR